MREKKLWGVKKKKRATYLMFGSNSSSSPFIVSPPLVAIHLSPSFFLSCVKQMNWWNNVKKKHGRPEKLTSVMRCTSRCLRASSLSRSRRSFSATRARSSVSSCSLNANSNYVKVPTSISPVAVSPNISEYYRTTWRRIHTSVILFSVSNFSSCASMVFSKSSCFLMSSSTCHIESPSLSSFNIGSLVCIHDSSRSASRLNNCTQKWTRVVKSDRNRNKISSENRLSWQLVVK